MAQNRSRMHTKRTKISKIKRQTFKTQLSMVLVTEYNFLDLTETNGSRKISLLLIFKVENRICLHKITRHL